MVVKERGSAQQCAFPWKKAGGAATAATVNTLLVVADAAKDGEDVWMSPVASLW